MAEKRQRDCAFKRRHTLLCSLFFSLSLGRSYRCEMRLQLSPDKNGMFLHMFQNRLDIKNGYILRLTKAPVSPLFLPRRLYLT